MTVYIVDDDASVRHSLERLVLSAGMRAEVFETVPDLVTRAGAEEPDCVIADIRMPGTSGLELPGRLAQRGHRPPVIFVTACVKGYQMPAAESSRSTKTPHWIIAVEPADYSGRR